MSRPAAVRLSDLRALSLGEIVTDLRRIHDRAFNPSCDDPICDLYGHAHWDPRLSSRVEKKAREEAREALTRRSVSPDLFWTLLAARVSSRWIYFSGTLAMFEDLFPERAS